MLVRAPKWKGTGLSGRRGLGQDPWDLSTDPLLGGGATAVNLAQQAQGLLIDPSTGLPASADIQAAVQAANQSATSFWASLPLPVSTASAAYNESPSSLISGMTNSSVNTLFLIGGAAVLLVVLMMAKK